MPADLKPQTYFGVGYSLTSTTNGPVVFGTNNKTLVEQRTLPNLTDTEASATTGDIRKLLWAFAEDVFQRLNAVNSAALAEDKLTKVAFSRSVTQDATTGKYLFTYRFTFNLGATTFEVANET